MTYIYICIYNDFEEVVSITTIKQQTASPCACHRYGLTKPQRYDCHETLITCFVEVDVCWCEGGNVPILSSISLQQLNPVS